MKPTFEAKVTGVTTAGRIAHMNDMRVAQNNLANGKRGGGSVPVPQFQTSGLPAGPSANDHIKGMAQQHLQSSALGQYNNCVGKPAGSCGGSRRRRRSRRSRRSRKYKVKR